VTLWDWLASPPGLTPHGFCLTWAPGLLGLHAGSDAVTAIAYFSIPLALARFVGLRRDLEYRWVAYLFGAFILACGLTHVMSIYTLWVPAYGVEGLVKLVTALLSIATAALLWPLIPHVAALPTPPNLRELNTRLSATVVEQARTASLLRESEQRVRDINQELERRVAVRTGELSAANAQLMEALAQRTAAEQARRENDARLHLAMEAAQLGIFEMDILANRGRLDARASEMAGAGLPADTWLALDGPEFTDWAHRIHPDDLPIRNAAAEALRSGAQETVRMEYRAQRTDGAWVWLTHWRAVVDRDPATGMSTRAVGVMLDTTDRARAEADLRAALGQRDLLLREVYHRVKNNLQIVDGLLLMQSGAVKDPVARKALAGLRGRIYALGLVHAQLMASKNLETFDIAPFLHELTHNIVAGAADTAVKLAVEAESVEVDLDFAVPVGLLVTELVTNSLRHAFPTGQGSIRVSLERQPPGQLVLTVADDGRGAEATDRPGVGSTIVQGLAKQLSAKLSVVDKPGHTTIMVMPSPEIP
jgi:two-component sensor histidine kinase/PAS domain-containing protein